MRVDGRFATRAQRRSRRITHTRTRARRGGLLVLGLSLATVSCTGDASSTTPAVPPPGQDDESAVAAEPTAPPVSDVSEPLPELGDPTGWADPSGSTVLFTNVTDASGVTHLFSSALEVELAKDTAIMMGGAGAGDFDRDGDTDLFVLGGGNELDALFVNDGSGNFSDVAEAAGLAEPHLGSGVAVGDYDADGWLDIFVTSHGTPEAGASVGAHRLYRNNGDLTFTDVAEQAGVATTSAEIHDGLGAVFGDVDLDGDLDLFVAGWQRDARGNRLFRNEGDGTFSDITDEAGIVDEGIRGFSPCFADMTGDRFPELLLVADFGTSRYFVNAGDAAPGEIRFTDATVDAGVGQEWSGMGTAVGDVDNDGMLDWYATAIFDADDVGRGDGNKLYLNRGGTEEFEEVALTAGVADGGWGWGALMVDVNQDGWLDIVETNGWDLPSYVGNLSRMWIADGTGSFTDVAETAGPLHNLHGLGVLDLDIDGDGDRDLAITASNDAFALYRNDLAGDSAGWLRVFLDTTDSPGIAPDGFGAVVRAEAGGVVHTRTVGSCSNFNTTSELSAHFGLGDADVIDRLTVEWPDGTTTVLDDVEPNQTITVTPTDTAR